MYVGASIFSLFRPESFPNAGVPCHRDVRKGNRLMLRSDGHRAVPAAAIFESLDSSQWGAITLKGRPPNALKFQLRPKAVSCKFLLDGLAEASAHVGNPRTGFRGGHLRSVCGKVLS